MGMAFGLQESLLILSAEAELVEDFEGLVEILGAVSYRPEQHDIAVEVWEVLIPVVTLLHLPQQLPRLTQISRLLRMLLKFSLPHNNLQLSLHTLRLPHLDFTVLLRLIILL